MTDNTLEEYAKNLMEKSRWLKAKLSEQRSLVEKSAKSEHEYRVALAQTMTTLRINGEPTTLIPDLARGDKNVAKLRMESQVASGVSDACREAIRALQSDMSAIQTLVSALKAEMNLR